MYLQKDKQLKSVDIHTIKDFSYIIASLSAYPYITLPAQFYTYLEFYYNNMRPDTGFWVYTRWQDVPLNVKGIPNPERGFPFSSLKMCFFFF